MCHLESPIYFLFFIRCFARINIYTLQLFTLCAKIRGRVQRKGEPHVRKIYTIDTSNFEQDQLHFSLNDNEVNLQLKPAGQLIADSDDFAFIYLLDAGEDYHYLRFPPSSWENLVHILQKGKREPGKRLVQNRRRKYSIIEKRNRRP